MTGTLKDSRRYDSRFFLALLKASIGIVCGLIMVIAAFVGVIRGYSAHSTLFWFLPSVLLFWAIFYFPRKESFIQGLKDSIKPSLENLFYVVFLVYISIGFFQGRHYDKGCKFLEQGLYDKAAAEFEKETRLWYLKVSYNMTEPLAMEKLAESYCRLEEYDKAVGVYELIASRYPGTYGQSASWDLERLKDGLRLIAQYNEEDIKSQNDYRKLYDMAHVYEYKLNSYKKAVDIYKTITEMNIPVEKKNRACEAIERLNRG